jgi:hypothetical protein
MRGYAELMREKMWLSLALMVGILRAWAGSLDNLSLQAPKVPPLNAGSYLCGVFLFGEGKEVPVWAVLDKSRKDGELYDLLYLDLNGNGDLTESGERFKGASFPNEPRVVFTLPTFAEPGTKRVHTDFLITWRTNRVSYKMKWNGGPVMMGGFGTDPESYGKFSGSFAAAPILVPGQDRPFQFQHWMSESLKRNEGNDFKVFLGNKGRGSGSFSAVDDKFLPRTDYVSATLVYQDAQGNKREVTYNLRERC